MPIKNKEDRAAYDAEYRKRTGATRTKKQAQWRADNVIRIRERDARRRLQKRAQCLINGARTRSKSKGIAFALDSFEAELQARIDAGRCELSGILFDLSPGRKPNSPSLDRINPAFGYIPDNVRLICYALNAALGDWGEAALAPIMIGWLRGNAINAIQAQIFIESFMEVIKL
jgi:hypothetical protein